jgi:hypothetical protein
MDGQKKKNTKYLIFGEDSKRGFFEYEVKALLARKFSKCPEMKIMFLVCKFFYQIFS